MTIQTRIIGGLGNQIFQFAAGYALARHKKTDLVLDVSAFQSYDLRDFLLNHFTLPDNVTIQNPKQKSKLEKVIQKLLPPNGVYKEPYYHFNNDFFDLNDDVVIEGYFQSEKYFQDYSDDIRSIFQLKNPISENSLQFKSEIEKANISVSLHVRRGDYITNPEAQKTHGSLGEIYYKNAIALIERLYGLNVTYFIFSDDMDYINNYYAYLNNKVIVSGNDKRPWEDMYLMSLCNHHILANSSFSWWGAWLNEKKDKTVIAPKMWFTSAQLAQSNHCDLYPEGWIIL